MKVTTKKNCFSRMKIGAKVCAAIFCLSSFGVYANAATPHYEPTKENLESRKEFQDAKFGIFLHWGLYSMLATGEWTMTNKDLNYKEYAKLAGGFYPGNFDAAKWVSAIKALVITRASRCSIPSIPTIISWMLRLSSATY